MLPQARHWLYPYLRRLSSNAHLAGVNETTFSTTWAAGDGRVVIALCQPARGRRYRYWSERIREASENAQIGSERSRAVSPTDLFESDFSEATVVILYLLPHQPQATTWLSASCDRVRLWCPMTLTWVTRPIMRCRYRCKRNPRSTTGWFRGDSDTCTKYNWMEKLLGSCRFDQELFLQLLTHTK